METTKTKKATIKRDKSSDSIKKPNTTRINQNKVQTILKAASAISSTLVGKEATVSKVLKAASVSKKLSPKKKNKLVDFTKVHEENDRKFETLSEHLEKKKARAIVPVGPSFLNRPKKDLNRTQTLTNSKSPSTLSSTTTLSSTLSITTSFSSSNTLTTNAIEKRSPPAKKPLSNIANVIASKFLDPTSSNAPKKITAAKSSLEMKKSIKKATSPVETKKKTLLKPSVPKMMKKLIKHKVKSPKISRRRKDLDDEISILI